jgi:hypothetical protein
VFVHGTPFQPSLMFAGKARAYPSDAPFRYSTNIRLGWKGVPGTNTLAYYKNLYLTAVKSFITLAPGVKNDCFL